MLDKTGSAFQQLALYRVNVQSAKVLEIVSNFKIYNIATEKAAVVSEGDV